MESHQPYQVLRGHIHDFEVEYRFLSAEEGGRKTGPPYQGWRSDFWYKHESENPDGLFMIWPEFLDDAGNVILYTDKPVPDKGKAYMWVVSPSMRPFHIPNISVGLKGYFMEGHKVAECTVTKVVGLATNPQTR